MAVANLLLQEVLFVQEANQTGTGEKTVVPHALEEINRLAQSIRGVVLAKCLIKVAAGDDKEESLDAFKHVYPFSSLLALSSHIEHPELLIIIALGHFDLEPHFVVTRRYLSAAKNIVGGGTIVLRANVIDAAEKAED